ncbi:hypothetical protein ON010_g14139 [Phytophthora cinnamomi]|nr:hypothetical protein ON010_g14139 [Phytophthora cinnamomi]
MAPVGRFYPRSSAGSAQYSFERGGQTAYRVARQGCKAVHATMDANRARVLELAEQGDWDEVLRLVESNAALAQAQDDFGMLPLHWASTEPSVGLDVIAALLRAFPGACQLENLSGMLPLHVAIKAKAPKLIIMPPTDDDLTDGYAVDARFNADAEEEEADVEAEDGDENEEDQEESEEEDSEPDSEAESDDEDEPKVKKEKEEEEEEDADESDEETEKQKRKQDAEEAAAELPFVFECPESPEELAALFKEHARNSPEKRGLILDRIVTFYNPRLSVENKNKMKRFFAVMVRQFLIFAARYAAHKEDLDSLARNMYTLAQQMGDTAGVVVRELLAQLFKRLHKRTDLHFPDLRLAAQRGVSHGDASGRELGSWCCELSAGGHTGAVRSVAVAGHDAFQGALHARGGDVPDSHPPRRRSSVELTAGSAGCRVGPVRVAAVVRRAVLPAVLAAARAGESAGGFQGLGGECRDLQATQAPRVVLGRASSAAPAELRADDTADVRAAVRRELHGPQGQDGAQGHGAAQAAAAPGQARTQGRGPRAAARRRVHPSREAEGGGGAARCQGGEAARDPPLDGGAERHVQPAGAQGRQHAQGRRFGARAGAAGAYTQEVGVGSLYAALLAIALGFRYYPPLTTHTPIDKVAFFIVSHRETDDRNGSDVLSIQFVANRADVMPKGEQGNPPQQAEAVLVAPQQPVSAPPPHLRLYSTADECFGAV